MYKVKGGSSKEKVPVMFSTSLEKWHGRFRDPPLTTMKSTLKKLGVSDVLPSNTCSYSSIPFCKQCK